MQVQTNDIILIVVVITCIFLVSAIFFFSYVSIYNEGKRKYIEEKLMMQKRFAEELDKTLLEVQEQTRKNVAQDLHDNVGQLLSLTNSTLGSIQFNDLQKIEVKIKAAQELVTHSIQELRQLSKLLHGEQLIEHGLQEAIEQEVKWMRRNDYYKIDFTNHARGMYQQNRNKDLFLYRLVQEAFNNIIKHADADTIHVELSHLNNLILLEIKDNGNGFDVGRIENVGTGMGLNNMQRRIQLLEGTIKIDSKINSGTTLSFSIPYP